MRQFSRMSAALAVSASTAITLPALAQSATLSTVALHSATTAAAPPSSAAATSAPPVAPAVTRPYTTATTVDVQDSTESDPTPVSKQTVSAAEVLSSAGTYGDFEKYLQVLPGVVFNSDESNDVLVRGGNPVENLYVIDGIEVPDINHITGEGTTGGFTSMIDTSSIQNVQLLSGGYGAGYAERLSSVIHVSTLGEDGVPTGKGNEAEAGYVGLGGHTTLHFGPDGRLLISAHRSLLNMVTNDIGLNGVPTYTNALISGSFGLGSSDVLHVLSLSGQDSIAIKPELRDPEESSTIQTQYSGWRTTNGLRWVHAFSLTSTGTLTASDSEQQEIIAQQDQDFSETDRFTANPTKVPLTPVYNEHTHDGTSILQYQWSAQFAPFLGVDAGSQFRLNRIRYDVLQPVGQYSPYDANPAASDATSFAPNFTTGQSGTWAELHAAPTPRLNLSAGFRFQTFAYGGVHSTLTPRLRASYRVAAHQTVYAAFGEYAQQPSYIYLTSYAQNANLAPIRVQHLVAGAELWNSDHLRLTLEAYRKHYWDYPVSTEYQQLSLANMVDTLGQEYVWLPLTSAGHGRDYGAELSLQTHVGRAFFIQSSLAYSRAFYSGLDGVYRPGNFDFPLVGNLAAIWRSPRHWEASTRYEYTTGRPYTPFLLTPSLAQDRPIYNLQQVNAVRGPVYSRLDFQVARLFHPGDSTVYVFGGLENAFDRQNFLGYAWMPHCANTANCLAQNGAYTAVPQIGLYPNFGARVFF